MEKSEIKVSVKLRDISRANYAMAWEEFCNKYGYNPFCMNEGADGDSKVKISLEDAENWGIII